MRFGMELHTEKRTQARTNSFIRSIVDVDKPRLPIGRQRFVIYRIPMVLARDITSASQQVLHRLIDASMSIGKFVCVSARSEC